jgi:hypothetical protein
MADDPNISSNTNSNPPSIVGSGSGSSPIPTSTTTSAPNQTITSTLDAINKSILSIHKILKTGYIYQKKLKDKQIKDEKEDSKRTREKVSEAAGKNKNIRPKDAKEVSKKSGGILDFIRNFVEYTAFGWILNNTIQHLPKLLDIAKNIAPLTSVIGSIVSGIFNIFVSVIDRSYAVFDKIRAITKNIGGEKFEKEFDKFSSTMNTFFNTLILLGMTVGATLLDPGVREALFGKSEPLTGRGGRAKAGKTGMTPAQTRYLNRYGEKAYQSKFGMTPAQERYLSRFGEGKFAKRFGFKPNQPSLGSLAKSSFTKASFGSALKGNAIFGVITLVGKVVAGDRVDKAIVTTIGSILGGTIGQVAGGFIGGALGTVVPFVGNVILAGVGAAVGAMLGGFLGDWLSEMLYDGISNWVQSNITNRKPKTAHARGGTVPTTRGGQFVRQAPVRTIKPTPKPLKKIQNRKPIPGKDIGGLKSIEKVFSNPSDPKYKNQLKLITKNAEIIGRRGDTFGQLIKIGANLQHGQKPDRSTVDSIANNFTIMLQNIIQDKTTKNVNKVTRSLFAMADGGYVPMSRTLKTDEVMARDFKKSFSNMLYNSINATSIQILNNIRKEFNLKDFENQGPGGGGGEGGMPSNISIGDFSAEDIDALGKMIYAEASGESDLGKAAVLAVILNRWRLIKAGKIAPSGFSIKNATKESLTLKDILFAPAQFSPYTDGSFARTTSEQGKDALAKALSKSGDKPPDLYKNLISAGHSPEDAEYIVKSVFFSNPNSRGSRPSSMREVAVGNHYFQQSPNVSFGKSVNEMASFQSSVTYNQGPLDVTSGSFDISKIIAIGGGRYGQREVNKPSDILPHHRGETDRMDIVLLDENGSTDVQVPSPVTGVIEDNYYQKGGAGNAVHIRSNEGHLVQVFHLKYKSRLRIGTPVTAFVTILGVQGSTGSSEGPHVHVTAPRPVLLRYLQGLLQGRGKKRDSQNNRRNQNVAMAMPSSSLISPSSPIIMSSGNSSQIAQIEKPQTPVSRSTSGVIGSRTYDDVIYSDAPSLAILPLIVSSTSSIG